MGRFYRLIFPHYKAYVIADFGDYELNVPIDDSVFTK